MKDIPSLIKLILLVSVIIIKKYIILKKGNYHYKKYNLKKGNYHYKNIIFKKGVIVVLNNNRGVQNSKMDSV